MASVGPGAPQRRLHRGRFFSLGSALLWAIVEDVYAGNCAELTRLLGVSWRSVAEWLYGDTRPEPSSAAGLIEPRLGIAPSAWTQPCPFAGWRLPLERRLRAAMIAALKEAPRQRLDQRELARAVRATLDAVVSVADSLQDDGLAIVRGATITLATSPDEEGDLTVCGVARKTGRTKQAVSQLRQQGVPLRVILETPKHERIHGGRVP